MVSKSDKDQEEFTTKPKAKKRGLFGFLPRWKRKTSNHVELEETSDQAGPKSEDSQNTDSEGNATAKTTSKQKKTPARKRAVKAKSARGATGKKTAGRSKASEKPTKKSTANKGKQTKASPPKKRARTKKQLDEALVAAKEDTQKTTITQEESRRKRRLFGFLRRRKEVHSTEDAKLVPELIENDSSEKPKKRGLLGLLKRKRGVPADSVELSTGTNQSNGKDEAQASIVEGEETKPKAKKKFLSKKMLVVMLATFGVTGASGAAAIVFAGPLLGVDDSQRALACSIAFEADFELMKEKRVTVFLRSAVMPPRERIQMLIQYTKHLETEYEEANLFTISIVDQDGPTHRSDFRGQNIGAQIVYAPDPLMTMATDTPWEIRYVNVDQTYAGKFIGDRYKLSPEDITNFQSEELDALDCESEVKDNEEQADENGHSNDENAEVSLPNDGHEKSEQSDDHNSEGAYGDHGENSAIAEESGHDAPAEPGFFDGVLAMVGLGADKHEKEGEDHVGPISVDVPAHEQHFNNEDVMQEPEKEGFFSGILALVGLGGDSDEQAMQSQHPAILGTRVQYH